ncbi:MAG TPA: 1-deoxy-D-xylulose-5-phosphate reductoisomerase [Bacteroidales bacterium]|nr:1-deoxy-D-xylulose-5-phosphate reductoisomerase [Bacteroidales bacterium]
MKRLAVLGSTGSIGTQTLDIVSKHPERFGIEILTANSNIELLIEQTKRFSPDIVVITGQEHLGLLKGALKEIPVKIYAGIKAVEEVVASERVDMVVAAMVGYSGLRPVIAAIRAGKDIALANKETLVVAGELIRELNRDSKSKIIPIDSEHSAILQCLVGEFGNPVEKVTLTASGGPFRSYTIDQMNDATPEQALSHPKWNMGNKITIDSASMMNKGLEVIEARWLFDLDPDQIEVIIHPQSIIHSFVHFADGSVKAQLGLPDMRLPIVYALEYPERLFTDLPRFNPRDFGTLTFEEVDLKKFRNLAIAYSAIREGGTKPCIMNAANEIAVDAFLNRKIGFLQMTDLIEQVFEIVKSVNNPSLEELEESDRLSREAAINLVSKQRKR